jgi:hypothetical protein
VNWSRCSLGTARRSVSLWTLVADLMLLDTEKHIRILELVAKNTGSV